MTIQIHEQLPPALAPLPGVTLSAGAHDLRSVSNGTPQLHARIPRREMQHTMRFARGEVLFPASDAHGLDTDIQDFVLAEGELVVLQDGRPVDLIEAGEWFTAWLWDDAQVVAHTDCAVRLVEQTTVPTTVQKPSASHQCSPTERMSDFLARLAGALTENPTCQPV